MLVLVMLFIFAFCGFEPRDDLTEPKLKARVWSNGSRLDNWQLFVDFSTGMETQCPNEEKENKASPAKFASGGVEAAHAGSRIDKSYNCAAGCCRVEEAQINIPCWVRLGYIRPISGRVLNRAANRRQ